MVSRLFPFKRGLCHAYWAPNFWALYNFIDKILTIVTKAKKPSVTSSSGLVQDIEHVVLPSVPPLVTFILSFTFMILPCLAYVYKHSKSKSKDNLVNLIIICAYSSFLFGWHVHEKAVLLILIPMSCLSVNDSKIASLYFLMSTISNYSLFPLIFRVQGLVYIFYF